MPTVSFARALALLASAGFGIYSRRRYPGRDEAYYYVFSHAKQLPIGFPVIRERVARKHYLRIKAIVEGLQDEEKQEESD